MTATISRPGALILSDGHPIVFTLSKKLNTLGCRVDIFTKDFQFNWKDLSVVDNVSVLTKRKYDYFFILDFQNSTSTYIDDYKSLSFENNAGKLLIVTKYLQEINKAKLINEFLSIYRKGYVKTIFSGTVINETHPYFGNDFIDPTTNKIILPKFNKRIYFSDSDGLVDFAIRQIFTFSKDRNVSYKSMPINTYQISEMFLDENIQWYESKLIAPKTARTKKSTISTNLITDKIRILRRQNIFTPIQTTLAQKPPVPEKKHQQAISAPRKRDRLIPTNKILNYLIATLLILFFVPIIFFYLSYTFAKINTSDTKLNYETLVVAQTLSRINKRIMSVYDIPFGNINLISNAYARSIAIESVNNIYLQDRSITQNSDYLIESVLGNSVKEPSDLVSSIRSSLDLKYKTTQLLMGDLSQINDFGLDFENLLRVDTSKILSSKMFLEILPTILGYEDQKEYFVVVQDQNILTPTGGRILGGIYLSFDGGRLSNKVYYDIKQIDENSPGHRQIPNPMENKNLLSGFVNSNLQSTFEENNQEILWYLDNALNLKPDGIFYVDVFTLDKLTQNLSGHGVLDESDGGFEDKITRFLESLADPAQSKNIHSSLIESLDTNSIILWFSDPQVDSKYRNLGYFEPLRVDCESCPDTFFSETNLSEHSSKKIKRSSKLDVDVQEKIIKYTMTYIYDSGDLEYDLYLRLTTTADSSMSPVKIVNDGESLLLRPDTYINSGYKTSGVLVKHKGLTEAVFEWELPVGKANPENQVIGLQMQPGVPVYSIEMNIKSPLPVEVKSENLTNSGGGYYNTDSSSDLFIRFEINE